MDSAAAGLDAIEIASRSAFENGELCFLDRILLREAYCGGRTQPHWHGSRGEGPCQRLSASEQARFDGQKSERYSQKQKLAKNTQGISYWRRRLVERGLRHLTSAGWKSPSLLRQWPLRDRASMKEFWDPDALEVGGRGTEIHCPQLMHTEPHLARMHGADPERTSGLP